MAAYRFLDVEAFKYGDYDHPGRLRLRPGGVLEWRDAWNRTTHVRLTEASDAARGLLVFPETRVGALAVRARGGREHAFYVLGVDDDIAVRRAFVTMCAVLDRCVRHGAARAAWHHATATAA